MTHFHTQSSKNSTEIELSVQNYVDPTIFVRLPSLLLDHLEIRRERYGRPAGRTRDARKHSKRQPAVVIKTWPIRFVLAYKVLQLCQSSDSPPPLRCRTRLT